MNNIKIRTFSIGLLILLLSGAAHACATTVSIADATVEPDGVITLPIMICNITDYGAGTINLEYDPSVVYITDVTDGPKSQIAAHYANNAIGLARISASNSYGVSGDIIFANVKFKAIGDGSTPVNLDVALLGDTSYKEIPATVDDGSITVMAGTTTTLISIPDVSATGMITVPITIENVSNAGSCQLTLSYDPDVVIVSSVSQSDFDSLFANLGGAASGSVSILAYQTSNPGLNGDVIVANVTFMIVGNNGSSTPLDLEVTTLTDATPDCNPIPYTIRDGCFTMFLNGDVNGDSRVDVADSMFLAKHLLGVSGFETIVEAAADVNGNGEIEASDCMYLAKHLAGMDGFEVLK